MFKFAAILLMLVVACHGFIGGIGGFQDRPELINDPTVQALIKYAAESLSNPSNALKPFQTTRVQVQVINGLRYKIDFTGELADGVIARCQVVINVPVNAEKNIAQAQCQS